MRPAFHPRLINGPFDDPGLFVSFQHQHRALLFDLGDLHALAPRDILKTSHVFITHTHIDHFIGFDRMLRLMLGRDKTLFICGPEGFLQCIEGKLAAYAWNLVDNFANDFRIDASEIGDGRIKSQTFTCRRRFQPERRPVEHAFAGLLLEEPSFSINAVVLDHGIPCLGYLLTERFHINIDREALDSEGLTVGPWLADFKQMLYENLPPETPVLALSKGSNSDTRSLGELSGIIARITPGQKIAYIVDVAYNEENARKIVELIQGADHLFIEAAFSEVDRRIATEKRHLTAWQAGRLARRAGAKRLTVFHFSPRYTGQETRLQEEAEKAFFSK